MKLSSEVSRLQRRKKNNITEALKHKSTLHKGKYEFVLLSHTSPISWQATAINVLQVNWTCYITFSEIQTQLTLDNRKSVSGRKHRFELQYLYFTQIWSKLFLMFARYALPVIESTTKLMMQLSVKCESSEERKSFVFTFTETILSCHPWE